MRLVEAPLRGRSKHLPPRVPDAQREEAVRTCDCMRGRRPPTASEGRSGWCRRTMHRSCRTLPGCTACVDVLLLGAPLGRTVTQLACVYSPLRAVTRQRREHMGSDPLAKRLWPIGLGNPPTGGELFSYGCRPACQVGKAAGSSVRLRLRSVHGVSPASRHVSTVPPPAAYAGSGRCCPPRRMASNTGPGRSVVCNQIAPCLAFRQDVGRMQFPGRAVATGVAPDIAGIA